MMVCFNRVVEMDIPENIIAQLGSSSSQLTECHFRVRSGLCVRGFVVNLRSLKTATAKI